MVRDAEVADGAGARRRAASARRRRRPRRRGPPRRNAAARVGPPSRKTCCRSRSCSVGERRARVAGAQVHGLGARRRGPGGRGSRSRSAHHHAQRLVAGSGWSYLVAHGELAGRRPRPCRCRPASRRTAPRSRWVSTPRRAAGDPAAGAVGGGAAAVEGGGELPGDERAAVLHGERPGPVERARLVAPAGRTRPRCPAVAQRRPRPRRRPGWGRAGRTRPGRRRRRSAPAAHGPVRPVWLHGSRVTTAVAPRAGRRPRPARRPRRAGCRRRGGSPRRPRCRPASSSTQPTRGLGPSGTPGVARELRARRIAALLGCGESPSCLPSLVRLADSGAGRRRASTDDRRRRDHLRALPIRTLTVGPGVPPGQPVTGCDRVADFHRRLGISPTPEHASSDNSSVPACHTRCHGHGRPTRVGDRAHSDACVGPVSRGARLRGLLGRRAQVGDHPVRVVGGEDGGARRRTRRRRPRRSARWSPGETPPSTWSQVSTPCLSISSRARRILGRHRSRNFWPPKPGSTVMISTMSSSGSRSS